jgi:arylsulfatase A-like enzyme
VKIALTTLWLLLIAGAAPPVHAVAPKLAGTPNIVLILADDLGYGDVGSYGATRVKTPNLDRLAKQGVRFTDAHSTSATCTPSRYALLTGEYPWRHPGNNILPGDASLIIQPGRATLPGLLRKAGYVTGAVGKWHLGLGTPDARVDWNGEIKPGPLEVGFDYAFLIPATGDRTPCVYVENHRVVGLDPRDPIQVSYGKKVGSDPTGDERPDLLRQRPTKSNHRDTIVNGISRIGFMSGGKAARWVDEDMADVITGKAVGFLERSRNRPFFLYFATHDIHVPRLPHQRFAGKTQMGPRGDAIVQFDWAVGEILGALDRLKLAGNTVVIVSSDNGPVVDDGYGDDAEKKLGTHRPAGQLRGGKYSLFEGGTRVPFLVRWPGRTRPGVSNALISQVDLLASLATLTGQPLAAGAGPDSVDLLPALLGNARDGREVLVADSSNRLALRMGAWKYIPPGKGADGPQLYDLETDPGETTNVAAKFPDKLEELGRRLEQTRSAPNVRR